MVVIIGIDLAADEKHNTGYCILSKDKVSYGIVHTDNEILKLCEGATYVGIDAPLSLPRGRESIEQRGPQFRECDLELRKLKIRFFPIFLGPMRKLTERGIRLKKAIKRRIKVYEVYPGATYDILNINRRDKKQICAWIKNELGIKLGLKESQDVLDGICAALTIKLFLDGKGREIGSKQEGTIVLPSNVNNLKNI